MGLPSPGLSVLLGSQSGREDVVSVEDAHRDKCDHPQRAGCTGAEGSSAGKGRCPLPYPERMFKGLRERSWAGQGQEWLCAQEVRARASLLLLGNHRHKLRAETKLCLMVP